MRKKHYGLSLIGIIAFCFLLPVEGSSEQAPPIGCPLLPEQPSGNAISLYVTKALDTPGVVCARVVNGLNHAFRTERLPRSGQSAPPGRYRVCFSSESVPPEGLQATICSAEFTLPSERKGLSTAGGRTVLRLGAMRKKHYEWLSIGADVGRLRIEP